MPALSSKLTQPLSLEAFRKKKEDNQSSKFKLKHGRKRVKLSEAVKIKVGVVQDKSGDGVLSKAKSRRIRLYINSDSDVITLLEKAVEKHARHYQQFDKSCKYVLLYHCR